jgi:hypothetical protein
VAVSPHFSSPIKVKKADAQKIPFCDGEEVFPAEKRGWLSGSEWDVRFVIARDAFSEFRIEGGARDR